MEGKLHNYVGFGSFVVTIEASYKHVSVRCTWHRLGFLEFPFQLTDCFSLFTELFFFLSAMFAFGIL